MRAASQFFLPEPPISRDRESDSIDYSGNAAESAIDRVFGVGLISILLQLRPHMRENQLSGGPPQSSREGTLNPG